MQKLTPEQLNARAFGEDSTETKVEEKVETTEKDTAVASQAESVEKKETPASEEEDESVVEQKVPYSRLRSAIERSREAERKAEDATRRLQELENRREESRTRSSDPYEKAIADRIKKLYGDNETSKEIIEIELARSKEIEEIAERKANEAYDRRQNSSRSEIEANERNLEEKLEDFSLTLGRDITPEEEERVLAIADKYSPIGEDGKYLSGEPLPLDRAWEIYEMELASQGQSAKKARSKATELTSSRSEGETAIESGDSDKWYPGRWRDRIRGK